MENQEIKVIFEQHMSFALCDVYFYGIKNPSLNFQAREIRWMGLPIFPRSVKLRAAFLMRILQIPWRRLFARS
jgi:hypothetical protein